MSETPSAPSRDRLPGEVWIISLIGFLVVAGFGVLSPSLPALAKEFNVGVTAMSVTVSGFAAMRLLANLAFARFLRSFRLYSVLWAGLLWQAVLSVIASFAPDFTSFIVLRSLSGLGSAAYTIASTALILILVPPAIRGRGMAIFAGATGLGTVGGPVIGGLFVDFGARVPIFVYGLALGIAGVVTVLALRRARDARTADAGKKPGDSGGSRLAAFTGLFSDKLILAAMMCQLVNGWIFYGFRTANIPLQMDVLGYSGAAIGALLAVASVTQILGSSIAGPVSDSIGRRSPQLVGLAFGVVSVAGLLFAGELWVAIALFALIGLAGGIVHTVNPTIMGDSPRGTSSFSLSVFWVVSDLAAVLGPIVSGALTEAWGFSAAVYAAIALTVPAFIAVSLIGPGKPQAGTSSAGRLH